MKKFLLTCLTSSLVLSGCAAVSSDDYASNVYNTTQLNSRQEINNVNILSILPAKVLVDNRENKQMAKTAGAILGGIAGAVIGYQFNHAAALGGGLAGATGGAVTGSIIKDKVQVEGVTIVYQQGAKTFTSTQAGRACQFKQGSATMISTRMHETRIQPNTTCASEG